ncbi:hypothetical protein D3C80_1948480 [compost metagenome]
MQRSAQFTCAYLGILQGSREQPLRTFQQAQHQVFHQDFVCATGDALLGRALQIASGFGVQRLDQLLKVYVDHVIHS